MNIDLDAARRARAEKVGARTVTLGGRSYALVPELYLDIIAAIEAKDIAGAVRLLLADPDSDFAPFMANRLSAGDLDELARAYVSAGGLPEASASQPS